MGNFKNMEFFFHLHGFLKTTLLHTSGPQFRPSPLICWRAGSAALGCLRNKSALKAKLETILSKIPFSQLRFLSLVLSSVLFLSLLSYSKRFLFLFLKRNGPQGANLYFSFFFSAWVFYLHVCVFFSNSDGYQKICSLHFLSFYLESAFLFLPVWHSWHSCALKWRLFWLYKKVGTSTQK